MAAFVKASMEGWKSYLQDPAPGNSLIGKANPQMGAEQIAFGIAQMKQYQLVTGGDAKSGGIGIITEPRLKKTWDMLVKNKLIDASKVPFEQTYTLEMVKDAGSDAMNTAPKLTVMSDTRFMPAAATPAIEVLSAEKSTATAPGRCCPLT
ncbi:ABC transporter substrate-binding protein [Klebsiella pneumoniae]|uniref:ABC transporter substrate-binding protein n=1 Tax=Klebsiella pneumoniae TaxID=573 RepID=A0A3S4I281_KLEPN|nr:ABC transporter substrate-binding protein [Klebsiella pneumoniae]